MEEFNAYRSSPGPDHTNQTPDTFRARQLPDVPEDVDFLMEHLNDPNFDLKKPRRSVHSPTYDFKEKKYSSSEIDGDSQFDYDRYSTERPESRNSTEIDFDE